MEGVLAMNFGGKQGMRLFGWLACSAWLAVAVGCGGGGTGPAEEGGIPIALHIDTEEPNPAGLIRICDELARRDLPATLFVNIDMASYYIRDIHQLYLSGFEIALLSSYLGDLSHEGQSQRLYIGLATVSGCPLCKTDQPVVGIRPMGFFQNESTYQLVDSLQFAYDAGFQARRIYLPGHEEETFPYRQEGYDFVAVPVSTVRWGGEWVSAVDREFEQRAGTTGEQWGSLLTAGLEQAMKEQEPLIVVVCDALTGEVEGEYWSAFLGFLSLAEKQGARFLTTERLVIEYATD
jgi:hypothetical protein